MDCERIEAKLPLFVARELSADEAASVSAHLDACPQCREALTAFASIEQALVARRDEVPAIDAFLPDLRAAGFRARRSILIRGFRAVMSVPGVAIVLVMWGALLIGRYSDRLTGEATQKTMLERLTAVAKQGLDAMVAAAGGDAWTLTAVYGALAIGVIVSAGALTMRLVRD
jgi:predicted anti-sigma-YlaC factor YlaD